MEKEIVVKRTLFDVVVSFEMREISDRYRLAVVETHIGEKMRATIIATRNVEDIEYFIRSVVGKLSPRTVTTKPVLFIAYVDKYMIKARITNVRPKILSGTTVVMPS